LYVGEYDDGTFAESAAWEGITASFSYCLPTAESSYVTENCGAGYFPAFDITVMTWDQWADHISEDSYGYDVLTKVGEDADFVYLFSHPNGDYPSDVPSSEDFFNEVIASFETEG
jgi:hypothetical protein